MAGSKHDVEIAGIITTFLACKIRLYFELDDVADGRMALRLG